MDWSIIITGITVIGFVYGFLRNFKSDINKKIDGMEKRLDLQDERIFLLATGKTLREAMIEAKKNEEARKN
jgi:hypothetical protein